MRNNTPTFSPNSTIENFSLSATPPIRTPIFSSTTNPTLNPSATTFRPITSSYPMTAQAVQSIPSSIPITTQNFLPMGSYPMSILPYYLQNIPVSFSQNILSSSGPLSSNPTSTSPFLFNPFL